MQHDPDDLPPQFRQPGAEPPRAVVEVPAEPPPEAPAEPRDEVPPREEPFLRRSR